MGQSRGTDKLHCAGMAGATWNDTGLYRLAVKVGRQLQRTRRRLTTAESCTAGWIAKALTDVPGSSQWFETGYVTYSNESKQRELDVPARTLMRHGAVSGETVRAMARGALYRARADLAVAVSGIAGPDGGTPTKPVGTVWFGTAVRRGRVVHAECRHFGGDRERVRRRAVEYALRLVLRELRIRGAARARAARTARP